AKISPADLPVFLLFRKRSGGSKMGELAILRKEIPPVLFLVKKWEWIYGTRQLISWLKFLLQIFRCSCSSGSA
ncbi:hypothetical protein C1638_022150, partial [Chryseobacterium oncorhynchi]